ncbi:polysaccharide biosynthesis protein, partial [candidate division KSB1 bacterium]
MDSKNKTIMVLGGTGLVGMAICRKLLALDPRRLVILALTEKEVKEGAEILRSEYPEADIKTAWGNIFVRAVLKDKSRSELLSNPVNRKLLIQDVLDNLDEKLISESYLYQLIEKYLPDIIIDSVNTATGLAYQDVFLSSIETVNKLEAAKKNKNLCDELIVDVEKLLCTQYVPQLIRHIQILYESTKRFNTKFYFKIGTSGTGGMGLNIPYTHSEERPSRVLLSKSSLAGAHTLLLFLMARTPDAPIIKEIKPTAAIAWKKIDYGKIMRGGKPIELYDCVYEDTVEFDKTLELQSEGPWKKMANKFLEAPYIDTGENGMFSRSEFQTITAIGQMGFLTPEEIATNIIYEIRGGNTGHDVINALDNACMGPTYRAGSMRHHAIEKLQELEIEYGIDSVAFEILGPPRLS